MGKVKSWLMGIGLAATGVAGGEIHGRNNAHDAAIIAQNEEQKREFDINTSEGKIAAEKAASEKKEQDIVAEKKEKKDQDIFAKAYNSQFSLAKIKLDSSIIHDPVEIQEMNKNNLKKLAEEIVGNSSKWLKYPDMYSGYLLADLSDNFTKEEIHKMAENIPDFSQLVSGQIAERLESLRVSKSAKRLDEQRGHTYSPEEIKDDKEYNQGLNDHIIKIQKLL